MLAIIDVDNDGIIDTVDNCRLMENMDQVNHDFDLLGYVCDPDNDNDGLSDILEASLGTNPLLADTDVDVLNDDIDPAPLTPNTAGDLAPYGDPDDFINAADLMIMQRMIFGAITPTSEDIIRGDIYPSGSRDGVIDTSDLLLLQQMVLKPGN